MASIIIEIDDGSIDRVLDAMAARYAYDSTGGQTKAEFVDDVITNWVRSEVITHEQNEAAEAARRAAPALVL
jgi:hypothetical protein